MSRNSQLKELAVPLIGGAAALTAIELARRAFRHAQLFCPSPDPEISWNPADYGIRRDAVEEHWFESNDGEMLYGWYCRSENPVASAIFCHGNTGNLTTTAAIIPSLLQAGINVLFFDYRGFGRSSGIPSINGVVADGVAAARFHDKIRPKALPSILYGYSLGGAVAAQVIKRHPFDGLILQSTFTSLPQITRALFPKLPLHLFAGNLFDTLAVIRRLTVPLLVVHGGSDEVVPCWMAHQLFDSCQAPKQIKVVENGLHKDLFVRDREALVWLANQFAMSLPRGTRSIPLEPPTEDDALIDSALRSIRRTLRRHTDSPAPL